MPNVAEVIRDHVTLTIDCVDRLYLNAYVPGLQRGDGVAAFLRQRGHIVPSPALFVEITATVKAALHAFCAAQGIPWIEFAKGKRKDDVVERSRQQFTAAEGVVLVGVAQERAKTWTATKQVQGKLVHFTFAWRTVYVNHYSVYLIDRDWGPAFSKICGYAPYAVKVCLNGHAWAKRQASRRGIGYAALDNGFLACADPAALQQLGAALSADHLQAFFERWLACLPRPLTAGDRLAGFRYHLSLLQMEVSRTQVLDDPLRGRACFEEVIRDNLDLGRPDRVQLLVDRRIRTNTPGRFCTRVITQGIVPSLHIEYKRCHIKQYWKEDHADYPCGDECCTHRDGGDRRSDAPPVRLALAAGGHRHGAAVPGAGLSRLGGTRCGAAGTHGRDGSWRRTRPAVALSADAGRGGRPADGGSVSGRCQPGGDPWTRCCPSFRPCANWSCRSR